MPQPALIFCSSEMVGMSERPDGRAPATRKSLAAAKAGRFRSDDPEDVMAVMGLTEDEKNLLRRKHRPAGSQLRLMAPLLLAGPGMS